MKELSLYDILGVITPGAIVTIGIITVFPESSAVLANKNVTVGEFGLVVLVSYIIGNLVAGVGNLLEGSYWRLRGGWPTERAVRADCAIIQAREREVLEEKLVVNKLIKDGERLAELPPKDWRGISRRIYLEVTNPNARNRIEVFNAQYGMNRGIVAGFIILEALIILHAGFRLWRIELLLAACTIMACYRMERFGQYYASELLRGYLCSTKEASNPHR